MKGHVSSSTGPQVYEQQGTRKELKSNRELGLHRTRGYDKLHLKSVKTEWERKSFGFQAAQDWNNLPENIRTRSAATFKTLETALSKLLDKLFYNV